jgi:hypothetical protein
MALSLEIPPGSGQLFLFCAPLSHPGPNAAGPCQGGGKTYTIVLNTPAGTKGFYQFQDVDARGELIVLKEGSFTAPAGRGRADDQRHVRNAADATAAMRMRNRPAPSEYGRGGARC